MRYLKRNGQRTHCTGYLKNTKKDITGLTYDSLRHVFTENWQKRSFPVEPAVVEKIANCKTARIAIPVFKSSS